MRLKPAQLLSTAFMILIGFFSSLLSIKLRTKLGNFLGDCMRILSRERENITSTNLRFAFPEKSSEWIRKTTREAYRNLGITFAEVLAFSHLDDKVLTKYINFENPDLLTELYSRGNGLILLSGHFGNWEFLAYNAGLVSNIPITIIVKPQKNEYADRILNRNRIRHGNSVVSMYNAARTIIHTLREGKGLALLADQSATSDKDLFVDFFGRQAATYEAPASLALKFKTPVVMGLAERQDDGLYRVKLTELETADLDDSPEGIKTFTERHVKFLEEAIRRRPELWAWQHRRWKHTPQKVNDEKASANN